MSAEGVQLLRHICYSKHQQAATTPNTSNSNINNNTAASPSVNVAPKQEPVTLREMIFSNGKRIVKPLAHDERAGAWAVRPERTRTQLLEELARRVDNNEDVSDVVAQIKKLPPRRKA